MGWSLTLPEVAASEASNTNLATSSGLGLPHQLPVASTSAVPWLRTAQRRWPVMSLPVMRGAEVSLTKTPGPSLSEILFAETVGHESESQQMPNAMLAKMVFPVTCGEELF